jgi:uncharacterized protein YqeY
MSLQTTINDAIKPAMMSKDQVRLDTLRGIKTAIVNELVSKGRKPTEELSDEEALTVIMRLGKQRKDSIEQYTNANRPELADEETAQLKVLEEYLPSMMSKDEILTIAKAKKEELGVTDKSKQGVLMSALMKDLKGKADGSDVKSVVESLF